MSTLSTAVTWRRDLHAHPEVGFTEFRTASRVAARLGVPAALPITESDAADHVPVREGFRSTHEGEMHACGHDGHVGMAVELAERLAADPPAGTVRLLFQPAEEGGRGAAAMVPAGVVDDVDVLLAAHLGIGLAGGTVAAAVDGLLANTKMRAVFRGVAAHAAMAPQDGRSALLAAAAATLAVHTTPPFPGHETRVAVGALHGGTSSNIVPDRAEVLLETRADAGAVNEEIEARVRRALEGAAATWGTTVEVERIGAVTTAVADAAAADAVARAARGGGLAVVVPTAELGVASDDATAFMRRVQERGGAATYLGIGSALAGPHHTPGFDLDEAVLAPGVDLLERTVRDLTG